MLDPRDRLVFQTVDEEPIKKDLCLRSAGQQGCSVGCKPWRAEDFGLLTESMSLGPSLELIMRFVSSRSLFLPLTHTSLAWTDRDWDSLWSALSSSAVWIYSPLTRLSVTPSLCYRWSRDPERWCLYRLDGHIRYYRRLKTCVDKLSLKIINDVNFFSQRMFSIGKFWL